jgi:hypothetical protein
MTDLARKAHQLGVTVRPDPGAPLGLVISASALAVQFSSPCLPCGTGGCPIIPHL